MAPCDAVEQARLAGLVARGARQPALLGPAAVAVHTSATWRGTSSARQRRAAGRRSGAATAPGGGTATVRPWPRCRDRLGRTPPAARRGRSRRGRDGLPSAAQVRSTSGRERRPRSRCHCRYAATSRWPRVGPGARWRRRSAQSPDSSAPSSGSVSGAGAAEPGGRQLRAHRPPGGQREGPVRAGQRRSGRSRRRTAPSRPRPASAAGRRPAPGRVVLAGRPARAARRRAAGTAGSAGSRSSGGQPLGGLQHRAARRSIGRSRATSAAPYDASDSTWVTVSSERPS